METIDPHAWLDRIDVALPWSDRVQAPYFSDISDLNISMSILKICALHCGSDSVGENWCWRAYRRLDQRIFDQSWWHI